ncbi:MAG: ABC transporter permease, partial [Beijerinckiaceae bacterium]
MKKGVGKFGAATLLLGFGFIYLPILLLVIYSFNDSRLVTVWGGFSVRWYQSLWSNDALMRAAGMSLRIAAVSASVATLLGVALAVLLARHVRFRGRTLLSGLVFAPVVLPEVITGLSLLLLFVAVNVERGATTVAIAHATFTTGFVAAIVQARLAGFDRSLEEAAADLGAAPLRVFFAITLPLIAPAVMAGWMLAFTLSLDDLVLASFTSGPGATTLPMRIYSQARLGVSPDINALGTLLIAVAAISALAMTVALRRKA